MKTLLSITIIFCAIATQAQSIVLDGLYPEELAGSGFRLTSNSTIKVEGSGAVFYEDWKAIIYYGWIIDSKTREVVWHQFDAMKDRNSEDLNGQIDFKVNVNLDAGNYEAYFAAAYSNGNDWNRSGNTWAVRNFDDVVKRLLNAHERRRFRGSYSDDFFMKVSGDNLSKIDLEALLDEKISGSVISFNKVRDDKTMKKGFGLSGETKLKIYAVGEGDRDETFDYLRIYNMDTRESVFEMDYDNTDFAGGAKKNLKFDGTVTLAKGNYMASYVTDDSHSYEKWNALPPDDPYFWGTTIWPASERDRRNIVEYEEPKTATPIVDLTRVRDDQVVSQGISLSSAMDVRILCIGEGDDSLVDYGWIINANTREKVWKMRESRSEHAGGARKNRQVSDVISLPAGDYIVYYSTDGSHSYGDWNDTRPHEADMWGITLWATNESDMRKVSSFDPSDFRNKNALVEILMVRDDEYIRETFTLDEGTDVRIQAVGEGSDGEMHDYAYIRDESGRVVWEMEYRDSDWAGGANKNREFNDKIYLKKGTYRVVYKTDGSHSYERWNASAPDDPEMWGIVILKE
ncbi:MAG: hypothetical protein RIM99_01265 [Cyclobacteriaceae bacterium]